VKFSPSCVVTFEFSVLLGYCCAVPLADFSGQCSGPIFKDQMSNEH
jgi:hypothetical protein